MSEKESNWRFAEELVVEPPAIAAARSHALEIGVESVSPAVGAQLALLAAAARAESILEVGTGVGVSGMWLLAGAPEATLTTIDVELEHQQAARSAMGDAGIPAARIRTIGGRALDVLPRMNDAAYDLVFIDADPGSMLAYLEHGLRIVRPGGVVAVAHALWRGKVANPASRGDTVSDFRSLLATTADSPAVIVALSTAGDGLLQLVKRAD